MIVEQLKQYQYQLTQALASADVETIKDVSSRCDSFLRQQLPLLEVDDSDIESIASELENLSETYKAAIGCVDQAKQRTQSELYQLGRNKSNTHKYLDIAKHL